VIKPVSREQALIDMMFEIAMIAHDLAKLDRDDRAKWVAGNLRDLGFDTEPRGMSWGVLKDPNAHRR
jgi:hypothetical protein